MTRTPLLMLAEIQLHGKEYLSAARDSFFLKTILSSNLSVDWGGNGQESKVHTNEPFSLSE